MVGLLMNFNYVEYMFIFWESYLLAYCGLYVLATIGSVFDFNVILSGDDLI